ncbi:MAG TPA: metallophosphoesterase [Candidatus Nanoarchaeia archaeon]|nr:metallophosphoesterase [Candidatus Nanoarchaeia archaeon]
MEPYKVDEEVEIIDLTLHLKKHQTLVIGDLHIGMEEALNKQGVLIPRFQFKELLVRLEKIISTAKPKNIILIGDVKHEFGVITETEWRNIVCLIDFLKEKAIVEIIKGNHDAIVLPIAAKRNILVKDHIKMGDFYLCHGHKLPTDSDFKEAKTIIMGHEHPAIGLQDGPRREMYKCFLVGKYKRKNLIILPSLSTLSEGTDVTKEQFLSPLIKNIKDFKFYIVSDKVYEFGKVKDVM